MKKLNDCLETHCEKALSNGWISVDDELPELFKDVLCFCDGDYEIASYDGDEFYDAEERCVICTHWQYLPQAPTSKD